MGSKTRGFRVQALDEKLVELELGVGSQGRSMLRKGFAAAAAIAAFGRALVGAGSPARAKAPPKPVADKPVVRAFWCGPRYADSPNELVALYREKQAEQAERAARRPKKPEPDGVLHTCPRGAMIRAAGPRRARRYGAVKAHPRAGADVQALGLLHFGIIRADRVTRAKKVNEPFRVTDTGGVQTPWQAERAESQPEA